MHSKHLARSLRELNLTEHMEYQFISKICDWERIEYGEGKHRTADILYECVKKNKHGFFILSNNSQLIGYADVWELEADFYDKLLTGVADEESLDKSNVLNRTEARTGLWYIGSIITDPKLRIKKSNRAAFAFVAICNAIPQFFKNHSIYPAKVLGVGSSDFGKKLLTKWGFEPIQHDENAIDLRPRFEKTMLVPEDADSLYLCRKNTSL